MYQNLMSHQSYHQNTPHSICHKLVFSNGIELGRVDIITEVSELASYLILLREGHLEAVFQIFNHLEKKHNARIVFDPSYPDINHSSFKECDWKSIYGDVTESIPPNAPPPCGKDVDIRLFVDSDHAEDQCTRRSRSGFLIYLNMSPMIWYSEKQATIKTSVFGAELVAIKHEMEALRGLRYKLLMMGVPIDGSSFIFMATTCQSCTTRSVPNQR